MTRSDVRKAFAVAALAGAALLAIGGGTGYVASQQLRPLQIATDQSLLQDVPPPSPSPDATTGAAATTTPASPAPSRSATPSPAPTTPRVLPLAKRISRTTVALPARLSYLEPGYNMLPQWRRIDTARAPGGSVVIAWQGPDGVHVTTLDPSLARTGPDTVVNDAVEIGGLVAHDDGFALLTRRPDSNKFNETAAHLVRYRDGRRAWNGQLTSQRDNDSTPVLGGQLRWDGSRYGAYFIVHGNGGFTDGRFGDKLVYVDDTGMRLPGGWNWGCSHNEGTALLPRAGKDFASLCFEDWRSGLFISTGIGAPDNAPVISREECWAGYCGGNFGGFVALPGGRYAVAFGTRGATSAVRDDSGRGFKVTAKFETHQVAVAFLSNANTPEGRPIPVATDPEVDHLNVRVAPYGKNRLLLSYETVASPSCRSGTCTGRFSGTHLQLLDLEGNPIGASTTVPDRFAGDIAVLPDGDLVWAYAAVTPSYTKALSEKATVAKLTVARLDLQPGS
jgi:hypothetical protein